MFHKVKAVNVLPDWCFSVQFAEGVTKRYDVKPLFGKWKVFAALQGSPEPALCTSQTSSPKIQNKMIQTNIIK